MPQICFTYTAINSEQHTINGELAADNFSAAYTALNKQGLKRIKVKRLQAKFGLAKIFHRKTLSSKHLTTFTRQLATMQTAGIGIVQALKLIGENCNHKLMLQLITQLKNEIEAGNSLAVALSQHKEFDALFTNLVAIGENTGKLDLVLHNLATLQEKILNLKIKLKKAMSYPAIVIMVAIIVSMFLLIKVVPTFKTMFNSLGATLPIFTRSILALSENIQQHKYKFIIIAAGIIWIVIYFYKKIIFKIPIFKAIYTKIITARFARILSITFTAGMSLQQSLLLIAKASNDVNYSNAINMIHDHISVGKSIHNAMRATKIFPIIAIQMIAIGEETGCLDSMLKKVASIYEEELDLAMDGIAILLEPLLMLVLGIIVGGLVIAMYMPIFNLGAII